MFTTLRQMVRWAGAGGERAQVGIATFDTAVHFYSLRPSQSQPQMLVVPDVADPYAPAAASLLCNVKASRQLVRKVLCVLTVSALSVYRRSFSGICGGRWTSFWRRFRACTLTPKSPIPARVQPSMRASKSWQ